MSDLSPEAKSKLEVLRQEYILDLPVKVEVLEKCWNSNALETFENGMPQNCRVFGIVWFAGYIFRSKNARSIV